MSERPGAPIDHHALDGALRAVVADALRSTAPLDAKAQLLHAVAIGSATLAIARDCLDDAVAVARSGGASWLEIGDILGISRQAAYQRFGT